MSLERGESVKVRTFSIMSNSFTVSLVNESLIYLEDGDIPVVLVLMDRENCEIYYIWLRTAAEKRAPIGGNIEGGET